MQAAEAPVKLTPVTRKQVGLVDWFFRGLVVVVALAWVALLVTLIRAPAAGGILAIDLPVRIVVGLVIAPGVTLVSVAILWRAPGNAVGRLLILLAIGLVGLQLDLDLRSPSLTSLAKAFLVLYAMGVVTSAFCSILLTFPTGRTYPPFLACFLVLYWVIRVAGTALDLAATTGDFYGVVTFDPPPLAVPALVPLRPLISWTIGAIGPTLPLGAAVGILSLRRRYRDATVPQRQQIKWVVWALGITFAAFAVRMGSVYSGVARGSTSLSEVTIILSWLAFTLVPIALGIGMLRSNLFDVDLVIRRTLVYGALTAIIVAIYVIVVGSLGALFHMSGDVAISLLATGVIAVVVQPLRERLQRGVSRLLYGERDEPYAVLAGLGQRLESALAPETVLPTIVDTVAQALKLPYVAIAVRRDADFVIVTSRGHEPLDGQPKVVLPLVFQGDTLGQLILTRRSPNEELSPADHRLLADLARQAGIAAHAVRLTADLQRSREQLVTAREEERRRLRRDLHDGLGPTLASLTLKLDAARNLLDRDPARTAELLLALRAQTQGAVSDIRRLVYDLRPPALDDLGLVSAIREQAAQLAVGLAIVVEGPTHLPPLPAAVEVAMYRIALEAVTNVVRHATARSCTVRIQLNDGLTLEVVDDGVGIGPGRPIGVGLTSMGERMAELGGSLQVEPVEGGGTRVIAHLPLLNSVSQEK